MLDLVFSYFYLITFSFITEGAAEDETLFFGIGGAVYDNGRRGTLHRNSARARGCK